MLFRQLADGNSVLVSGDTVPSVIPGLGGTQTGWMGGCELDISAARTVELDEGRYTLMVRGHPTFNDPGGTYLIEMVQ